MITYGTGIIQTVISIPVTDPIGIHPGASTTRSILVFTTPSFTIHSGIGDMPDTILPIIITDITAGTIIPIRGNTTVMDIITTVPDIITVDTQIPKRFLRDESSSRQTDNRPVALRPPVGQAAFQLVIILIFKIL